jgi:hypothetical protein
LRVRCVSATADYLGNRGHFVLQSSINEQVYEFPRENTHSPSRNLEDQHPSRFRKNPVNPVSYLLIDAFVQGKTLNPLIHSPFSRTKFKYLSIKNK